MKPPRFTYHDPTQLPEALELLAQLGADSKVLAGGQSLIPLLNMRMAHPEHLIDLNRIHELAYLSERDGGIAIGAMNANAPTFQSAVSIAQATAVLPPECAMIAGSPFSARPIASITYAKSNSVVRRPPS